MTRENTCFYPGKFSPPTKFHLNTLFWLITRPEVGHVNVVIGKDEPGELPQEQKAQLWELLLKSSMAPRAAIIKSKDAGPMGEIYNIFAKKPDMEGHIALDEDTARNKKLQEKLSVYPNYTFQLTPSKFDKSSAAMIKAIQEDNKQAVKQLLPDDFSESMVDAYIAICKPKDDPEAPEEKSPLLNYQQQYNEMFNDGFWNSVFQPMVEDISASEAYNDGDSLKTVADGKRNVAFITILGATGINPKDIPSFIKDNGLKSMYVKGNEHEAYVVYRPGSEHPATQLKDIAEKYGGYLSPKATKEETEQIGKILGYKQEDVDAFIKKHYNESFISIYESGVIDEILFETSEFGQVYEADISPENGYEYHKTDVDHKDEYRFKDKNDLEHTLYYLPSNYQLKVYYIDPKTGKESTDKNLQPDYDPKVMNTYAKIIIDKLLPNYSRIDIMPLGAARYRLFRAMLVKYLDTKEWDIKTNVEDAISLRKKDKKAINEVATDLSSAYDWKYVGGSDNKYTFTTGETDYKTVFVKEDEGMYERIYAPLNKDMEGTETKEGKAIPINATVMAITIDFLEKNKDWYMLTIHPIDAKRYRLVMHFIDNTLPDKYAVEEIEGVINITRK